MVLEQRCFFNYIIPMIISASRRCDIPRFKTDWLRERFDAGFADVANPFNSSQVKRVSLKPDDAGFLVFWTRDPGPLLNMRGILDSYPFYIMVTLTNYPEIFEPNAPRLDDVIRTMAEFSQIWDPKRVIWRYDPVLLTSITEISFHKKNFANLAARLSGITEKVIISIYDEYAGAKRRLAVLEKENKIAVFPHCQADGSLQQEISDLLSELVLISKKAKMEIQSCAEKDLAVPGISRGACIDGNLIDEILKAENKPAFPAIRDKNQRSGCLCVQSVDIGSYGACPAGCVYCYGRR